jgi:spore maturation protein SpmA
MKNNSTILIEVLLKTIDKMGIKKTIQVLEISQNFSDEKNKIVELIILNTCNAFLITENVLKHGKERSAERINAVIVCSILLMRLCKISQRDIAVILNKDPSLINKYIKRHLTLNINVKEDAELNEKIEEIRNKTLKQIELNS